MKDYKIEQLRTIALIGHGGTGKTSLAEAILFDTKATTRLGKVAEGNTVTDYDPEEIKRQISINAAIASIEWKNNKLSFIDTPGYADFTGDVMGSLRVADGAVVVVRATTSVEVQTEEYWRYADEQKLPRLVFVNKIDRENANFMKAVAMLRDAFGKTLIPIQLPIGSEQNFKGIVDIVKLKAYVYPNKNGQQVQEEAIPDDLMDEVEDWRAQIIDAAAEADDDLTAKYLEGEELTLEEIELGLRKSILAGKTIPILCGTATFNLGIQPLLDSIVDYLPSPMERPAFVGVNPENNKEETRDIDPTKPFSAFVFKTVADPFVGKLTYFKVVSGTLKADTQVYNASKGATERIGHVFFLKGKLQEPTPMAKAGELAAVAKLAETTTGDTLCAREKPIVYPTLQFPEPVYSVAVQPKAKGDEDKIGTGIARLAEEDPTISFRKDVETKEMILSGLGDIHLDVNISRLKKKFGVDVLTKKPKVPFRETIKSKTEAEYKHKKQSGGHGQYGHVKLKLQPLEAGQGFVFAEEIFGGAVPKQYFPGVEKGIREALKEGALAGYPVVDVKVTLYDGSYHDVDSSEMAFKIAASQAFKKGALQAKPILLEPIYEVEIYVPSNFMGDVIGDLNSKRGRILGMEQGSRKGMEIVKAMVPLSEMFNYALELRSLTQGRANFRMKFSSYEEVPGRNADEIIAAAKKEREQLSS